MKILIIATLTLLLLACNNNETQTTYAKNDSVIVDKGETDSTLIFKYEYNIQDTSLINTSGKSIDVLYNGIQGFLGGQQNDRIRFNTECMVCETMQAYDNGFVFGKRLYFDNKQMRYFPNELDIPDTFNSIKSKGYYGERKKVNFTFGVGTGTMSYQAQSCNDADYVGIQLMYDKGSVTIDKLINASFFEFDLDKDGILEQYLFGTRNCSQEIAVLRIR